MKKLLIRILIPLVLMGCEDVCMNDVRVFEITSSGDVELFVGENVTIECDVNLPFLQTVDGVTWRYELK